MASGAPFFVLFRQSAATIRLSLRSRHRHHRQQSTGSSSPSSPAPSLHLSVSPSFCFLLLSTLLRSTSSTASPSSRLATKKIIRYRLLVGPATPLVNITFTTLLTCSFSPSVDPSTREFCSHRKRFTNNCPNKSSHSWLLQCFNTAQPICGTSLHETQHIFDISKSFASNHSTLASCCP